MAVHKSFVIGLYPEVAQFSLHLTISLSEAILPGTPQYPK
jgi:hypothetical protein